MKRFFGYKKWIAFLLVFLMAVSVSIASSDPFLWAAGEYEDEESGAPAAPATVEAVKEIKVPDNDKADRIQKPQDVYVYIAFTGVDTANVTEEYMREKYKYPKGTILEDGGKLWYTVGVIRGVPMYSEPEKPVGDSVCYASDGDKKAVLDRLGDIERFGDDVKNELPIPLSSDGGWTLKGASGAVDYDTDYNVEHPARWHLDCLVDLSKEVKESNVYAYVEIVGLDETDEKHRERVEDYYGLGGLWQGRYYPVGVVENVPFEHDGNAADIPGALNLWDTMKAVKVKDPDAIKEAVGNILSEEEKPIGWSLKSADGANGFETDYPGIAMTGNACWHLDGVIDLTRSADVVYLDENGDEIEEKGVIQTTAFKTTDNYTGSLEHAISGYSRQGISVYRKYGSADQTEVTGKNDDNVIGVGDDLTFVLRYRSISQPAPVAAGGGGEGGGGGDTPAEPLADAQPVAVLDVPVPAAGGAQRALPRELVTLGDEEVPLQGAQTDTDEKENVEITVVGEEKVPLAGGMPDTDSYCGTHFLLLSAALIILIFYAGSMKKYQKKLARLRDQLSEMQETK